MSKDELFKLAVQLASGAMTREELAVPRNVPQISVALRVAYNALLDAYKKIPDQGSAPTDH